MRVIRYNVELGEERKNILVKEDASNYTAIGKETKFSNSDVVARFARDYFRADKKAEEYVWLLALDSKNQLIGCFQVNQGLVNSALIGNREIFVRLLLCGAAHGIVIHNHPSGCSEPSKQDYHTTEKLIEAGKILGCDILDHIIIGQGEYCSILANQIYSF